MGSTGFFIVFAIGGLPLPPFPDVVPMLGAMRVVQYSSFPQKYTLNQELTVTGRLMAEGLFMCDR